MVSSVLTVGCAAVAMRRMSVNFAVSLTLYVLLGLLPGAVQHRAAGPGGLAELPGLLLPGQAPGRWLLLNVLAQLLHSSTVIAVVLQLVAAPARSRPGGCSPRCSLVTVVRGGLLRDRRLEPRLPRASSTSATLAYLQGQQSGIGTYLYLLSRVLLVALLLTTGPQDGEIDRYITLSMVGVCLLLLGTQAEAIGRLELYFGIYLVVALPRAAREIPPGEPPVVSARSLLGALAFYLAYLSQFGDLVPYHFDWALARTPGDGPGLDDELWTLVRQPSRQAAAAHGSSRSARMVAPARDHVVVYGWPQDEGNAVELVGHLGSRGRRRALAARRDPGPRGRRAAGHLSVGAAPGSACRVAGFVDYLTARGDVLHPRPVPLRRVPAPQDRGEPVARGRAEAQLHAQRGAAAALRLRGLVQHGLRPRQGRVLRRAPRATCW